MARISSHVLNAIDGTHGIGVRVECMRLDGAERVPVFDVESSEDGRIAAEFELQPEHVGQVHELVFHLGEYFDRIGLAEQARIMPTVVFRLALPEPEGRYHIPVVASTHGYSVWWSTPAG